MKAIEKTKRIEQIGTIVPEKNYSVAQASKFISCGERTLRAVLSERKIKPENGKILAVDGQTLIDIVAESKAIHDEIDKKKEAQKAEKKSYKKNPKQTEMNLSDAKADRRITINRDLLAQCTSIAIKSDDGDTTALINRYIAAQLKKVNS
jgi:hypothetical protein